MITHDLGVVAEVEAAREGVVERPVVLLAAERLEARPQDGYVGRPEADRGVGELVEDDGEIREDVLANAPEAQHGFFAVPKVIE